MPTDRRRRLCRTWRCSGNRHTTLAVAALAFLAASPWAPGARTSDPAPPSLQLAAGDEDAGDEDELQPQHQHGHQRQVGAVNKKTAAHGYDPHRIQRFWSHYHAARPESKSHGTHTGAREKTAR